MVCGCCVSNRLCPMQVVRANIRPVSSSWKTFQKTNNASIVHTQMGIVGTQSIKCVLTFIMCYTSVFCLNGIYKFNKPYLALTNVSHD